MAAILSHPQCVDVDGTEISINIQLAISSLTSLHSGAVMQKKPPKDSIVMLDVSGKLPFVSLTSSPKPYISFHISQHFL